MRQRGSIDCLYTRATLYQADASAWRGRYVYLMMGVIIGSAVCPIAFCMVWSKCTATGAVSGALTGLVAAVCAWLGYTKANYGVVNLTTTGAGADPDPVGCRRGHAHAGGQPGGHPGQRAGGLTLTLTLTLSAAGEDMPMLVGNLVAILASGLVD